MHSLATYVCPVTLDLLGKNTVIALLLQSTEALQVLHHTLAKITQNTSDSGFFLPHITLARIKKVPPKTLRHIHAGILLRIQTIAKNFPTPLVLPIETIVLFASEKSHHIPLATFTL